jgi:cell division protein FtsZ
MPGLINLDFADVRLVMSNMGPAAIGTGESSGPNRAVEAAEAAISNPLLDSTIDGATGLIISIAGGEDMRLMEVDEAASRIRELADPEAEIIWGSALDPALGDRMRVSIIATGLGCERPKRAPLPFSAGLFEASAKACVTVREPDRACEDETSLSPLDDLPEQPKPTEAEARPAATLFERMSQVARTEHRVFPPAPTPAPRERRILLRA